MCLEELGSNDGFLMKSAGVLTCGQSVHLSVTQWNIGRSYKVVRYDSITNTEPDSETW
jgi:hypothetical protein